MQGSKGRVTRQASADSTRSSQDGFTQLLMKQEPRTLIAGNSAIDSKRAKLLAEAEKAKEDALQKVQRALRLMHQAQRVARIAKAQAAKAQAAKAQASKGSAEPRAGSSTVKKEDMSCAAADSMAPQVKQSSGTARQVLAAVGTDVTLRASHGSSPVSSMTTRMQQRQRQQPQQHKSANTDSLLPAPSSSLHAAPKRYHTRSSSDAEQPITKRLKPQDATKQTGASSKAAGHARQAKHQQTCHAVQQPRQHQGKGELAAASCASEAATGMADQAIRQMSGWSETGSAQSTASVRAQLESFCSPLTNPQCVTDLGFSCDEFGDVQDQARTSVLQESVAPDALTQNRQQCTLLHQDTPCELLPEMPDAVLQSFSVSHHQDPLNRRLQLPSEDASAHASLKAAGSPSEYSSTYTDQSGVSFRGGQFAHGQRPLQLDNTGLAKSADSMRQEHQLRMLDLMLARVSAADEGMCQNPNRHSQLNPYLAGMVDYNTPMYSPIQDGSSLSSNALSALMAPLMPSWHSAPIAMAKANAQSFRPMGSTSLDRMLEGEDLNFNEQGIAEMQGELRSDMDCPGSCLVPDEWLMDDCSEVDFPAAAPQFARMALPLMPPSLGACASC